MTYGLRWEMVFPERVNGPGNGAEYNLNTGLLDVFGTGLISGHGYQSMNWHNFAPRVGIAYQITPKTVIRTGYGWSYSLGTFGSTFGHNVTQNPPVLANQSLTSTVDVRQQFLRRLQLGHRARASADVYRQPAGNFTLPYRN